MGEMRLLFVAGFVVIISYLLGSISTSYIVGRQLAGIDIREYGSGNAGATNTMRVLGLKVAAFVFVVDVLKGIVACKIALWLTGGDPGITGLAAGAAIIGHNWPVFFRFRGGKGVATTIGVMLSLLLAPAATAGVFGVIILAWTRYVSLASLSLVILTPVFVVVYGKTEYLWLSLFIAIITIFRHRTNIVRLLEGRESKLGVKKRTLE